MKGEYLLATLFGQDLNGADCLVYGFGRANSGVTRYLLQHGANVFVCDGKMTEKEVEIKLEKLGLNAKAVKYGENVPCDYIFRTPGMRADNEVFSQFKCRVTDETRLFLENVRGRVIGVTGSDGKTTTSTITSEILKNAFRGKKQKCCLCGNIGAPMADFIDKILEDDVAVVELSSFQLIYSELSPQVSAITNFTENHLDWHKTLDEYANAKCRIFEGKGAEKLVTDRVTSDLLGLSARRLPKDTVYIGEGSVQLKDGKIYRSGKAIVDVSEITLKGEHNLQNIMTAGALTDGLADDKAVRKAACEFCGAPHRMSLVGRYKGIGFYDSSIDSTPSRTIATLKCFERPLTVIVGGYDKNLDYSELAGFLSNNVTNVVVTGSSSEKILYEIHKIKSFGAKVYTEPSFYQAVCRAAECGMAEKCGSVVLSPACASFDTFANYEERGNKFSEIVRKQQ